MKTLIIAHRNRNFLKKQRKTIFLFSVSGRSEIVCERFIPLCKIETMQKALSAYNVEKRHFFLIFYIFIYDSMMCFKDRNIPIIFLLLKDLRRSLCMNTEISDSLSMFSPLFIRKLLTSIVEIIRIFTSIYAKRKKIGIFCFNQK